MLFVHQHCILTHGEIRILCETGSHSTAISPHPPALRHTHHDPPPTHRLQEALRWCLVLQEALLWQEWPGSVVMHDKFREERDEHGGLLFRGPR